MIVVLFHVAGIMEIIVKKDWEWFIAEVAWKTNAYAFWYTKEEAIKELNNVVDMMVDYYNELKRR